jgi:Zn-finger domain-containing protein
MRYLEQENRAMTSILEGQAEQLSNLKLEMARLREFEESLRRVSGLGERPNP